MPSDIAADSTGQVLDVSDFLALITDPSPYSVLFREPAEVLSLDWIIVPTGSLQGSTRQTEGIAEHYFAGLLAQHHGQIPTAQGLSESRESLVRDALSLLTAGFGVSEEHGTNALVLCSFCNRETRTSRALARPLPFLDAAFSRITEIGRLEEDWDTYGAPATSGVAIRVSRRLLLQVADRLGGEHGRRLAPYAVMPVPGGGIQMEWRGSSGMLEVEITPDGRLGYLLGHGLGAGRQFAEADDVDADAIERALRDLLEN